VSESPSLSWHSLTAKLAVQLTWKETDLIKMQSSNTAHSFLFNLNTLWPTTNNDQRKGGSSDQKKKEVVSPHQEVQGRTIN